MILLAIGLLAIMVLTFWDTRNALAPSDSDELSE